jgi:hypothetical protein
MAFLDIRHGSIDGPIIESAPPLDGGSYFVEGRGGEFHGPFESWSEASGERDRISHEHMQWQAAIRAGRGRGD